MKLFLEQPMLLLIILSFFFKAIRSVKNFVPLMDRVLIQKAEAVTKSKGGILIPEKAQSKVNFDLFPC